jgi:ASC-1-like (ASCH) protein
MFRPLYGGEYGKKAEGWFHAEQLTKSLVIVLLFIIVVIAAVCWVRARALQGDSGHSYRCGGAEEFDDEEYHRSGGFDSGSGRSAQVADNEEPYLGGLDDPFGANELSIVGGGDGIARLGIREPGYTDMLKGKKKVEGRLRRGAAVSLKVGDLITVARSRAPGDVTEYGKPYRYITKVKRVSTYKTIKDLVHAEKADHLFPGKKMSADDAVGAYREHFKEADEAEVSKTLPDAVVAIEVEPYDEKKQAEYAASAPPREARGARGARSARAINGRSEQHFY